MVMGSLAQETDVLVIGAGPGGYVAAIHAADLGLEVTLVEEREQLGGVCLLEGCIPSKALVHATELAEAVRGGKRFGLLADGVRVDRKGLQRFRRQVSDTLAKGVRGLLERRGVEIVRGRARFEGPHRVALEGAEVAAIEFRRAILATGSRVKTLPLAEGMDAWTSRDALSLEEIPGRLLVVGAGYIGLELGFVYAGLGSEVSVVEVLPEILAGVDRDLAAVVEKSARRRFRDLWLETTVRAMERDGDACRVVLARKDGSEETREFDRVLLAVGRTPNTDGIGLEALGLETDERGFLPVDDRCRTRVPHVLAIGDVTPGPMLAHRASRQAKVAAEVLAGKDAAYDNACVPAVVFTDPEVATVGMTLAEAEAQGADVTAGKFPLAALGRALAMGKRDGFARVIAERGTGRILGAGIVGPHASDVIAEMALAIEMGATLEDLAVTIHPHPTISEAWMEAAEVALGEPVHVFLGTTGKQG